MIYLILIVVLFALMFVPQYLTANILKKYATPRSDFPGNGSEFAQHLIDRFQLTNVTVESTQQGDHYDPRSRTVRLLSDNYNHKSLTAIVVAAHEVGHAIQHHTHSGGLTLRTRLAMFAFLGSKAAQVCIILVPILMGVSPGLARLALLIVIGGIALSTLVQLITLPVEWDASFNKALPILAEGNYLQADDLGAARRILLACAFTYVSAALGSIFSLLRFFRWLPR